MGRVRTGAVRDLFGVGKCHELAEFRGQLVRAGAGSLGRSSLQLVAVGWVNRSPVGRDLPPVGAVGWSVVGGIVKSGSGDTAPKW